MTGIWKKSTIFLGLLSLLVLAGGGRVSAAVGDCPADTVPPKPIFTNPPSPGTNQTPPATPTPNPLTPTNGVCPPTQDTQAFQLGNNGQPKLSACTGVCSTSSIPYGTTWNVGGVQTLTPTGSASSCLGMPTRIIDRGFSYGTGWQSNWTLDPFSTTSKNGKNPPVTNSVTNPIQLGSGNYSQIYIEDRFQQQRQVARIYRFRTPPQDGAIIRIYSMNFQDPHPWTSFGLSRIPCDTSSGIGGLGPIVQPTSLGQQEVVEEFLVKKNATSQPVGCQSPGSQMNGYQIPQLEADTIYYLTMLDTNPDPTTMGFDSDGDGVDDMTISALKYVSISFKVDIPPPSKPQLCPTPPQPAPAVCP